MYCLRGPYVIRTVTHEDVTKADLGALRPCHARPAWPTSLRRRRACIGHPAILRPPRTTTRSAVGRECTDELRAVWIPPSPLVPKDSAGADYIRGHTAIADAASSPRSTTLRAQTRRLRAPGARPSASSDHRRTAYVSTSTRFARARFVRFATRHIPLITFEDVPGFSRTGSTRRPSSHGAKLTTPSRGTVEAHASPQCYGCAYASCSNTSH